MRKQRTENTQDLSPWMINPATQGSQTKRSMYCRQSIFVAARFWFADPSHVLSWMWPVLKPWNQPNIGIIFFGKSFTRTGWWLSIWGRPAAPGRFEQIGADPKPLLSDTHPISSARNISLQILITSHSSTFQINGRDSEFFTLLDCHGDTGKVHQNQRKFQKWDINNEVLLKHNTEKIGSTTRESNARNLCWIISS